MERLKKANPWGILIAGRVYLILTLSQNHSGNSLAKSKPWHQVNVKNN